jgi:hypothetical protein
MNLPIYCAPERRPARLGTRRAARRFRQSLLGIVLIATAAARASAQENAPKPAASSTAPLQLQYTVRIVRPTTHLLEIEIDARGVNSPTLEFAMPVWSPGRYAIYDFAKNVQEFNATGKDGRELAWMQPDKQTWRVETGGASEVEVRF